MIANSCENGNNFWVPPQPITDDHKQEARDREISIFTSCLRRAETQMRGITICEHNRKLLMFCDCLRSIGDNFVHAIRVDESEASMSNENSERVRLWQ